MAEIKGVDAPRNMQAEIIARFMSEEQFARFVEAYRDNCKASFGGHQRREVPDKYYDWLEQYKSGVDLRTISNRAGVNSKIVYNAIKTAALRKALA